MFLRLCIALLLLAGALAPAQADEYGDAVAALGKGGFGERAAAIENLGGAGRPARACRC